MAVILNDHRYGQAIWMVNGFPLNGTDSNSTSEWSAHDKMEIKNKCADWLLIHVVWLSFHPMHRLPLLL